jgi:UDP-4-amino-4,6-dideoxy-N-acetyl-beta-L-altrosamine transaminase
MTEPPRALPYGRHLIEDDDVAAVTAALRGGFLTTGPAVEAFEAAFAARVGARHAVVCSSGTAALHLATLAAGLGAGDVAIAPAITFLATANAVRYVGAEVIFADVEAASGLMRKAQLDRALAEVGDARVRAVLPVHLAGQCADMAEIRKAAAARDALVIEDACHAVGASYLAGNAQVPVGACRHSDMCVFSFHPVKTIAMGEGGAVTTNDDRLAERLRRFRAHGMTREPSEFEDAGGAERPWWYEMPEPGFNYRASDINCALGLSQLAKLDRFVAERRRLADSYDRLLAPLAPHVLPLARIEGCQPAWHIYVARIDFAGLGRDRGAVMRGLKARGIGTQVHYIPVCRQPYYRRRYGDSRLPGADAYYERALTLPLFVGMSEADAARAVEALAAELGLS